jgi:hypothetical protein
MEIDFQNKVEAKWPEKSDKLFKAGDRWDVYVGWTGINIDTYSKGFKEIADLAAIQFIEHPKGNDSFIFPIVFLYRQYIELRLKSIIFNGNKLFNRSTVIPNIHRLKELWLSCKILIEEIWPTEEKDVLEATERLIFEFDSKDQGSTNYRYPTDRMGNPSVVEGERLDMNNLLESMNKLACFLDSCDNGIVGLRDMV